MGPLKEALSVGKSGLMFFKPPLTDDLRRKCPKKSKGSSYSMIAKKVNQ